MTLQDNFLKSTNTDVFSNVLYPWLNSLVLYVDDNNESEINHCVKENYDSLKALFQEKGIQFIISPEFVNREALIDVISYYFPKLNTSFLHPEFMPSKQFVLDFYGFKGEVKPGLLLIDEVSYFTKVDYNTCEAVIAFFENYVDSLYFPEYDDSLPQSAYIEDEGIQLDEETKQVVSDIFEKFEMLKSNGQLLQLLPVFDKYINENEKHTLQALSQLHINQEGAILLPEFNDLEIKLSPLTKCVYFLFLNHPEGIMLNELQKHKEELLHYYKQISNRLDYTQMKDSINDITNTETNAIYVHLSRIKSVFTKSMHPRIAENYIVTGAKDKPKGVTLESRLINFKGYVNEFDS